MTTDTPVDALTRQIAAYLESAEAKGVSEATQRKHFRENAAASPAEIENLYNVGAWYLLFGYPPKFPAYANQIDATLFTSSRHTAALTRLRNCWKQLDTVAKIRKTSRDEIPLPTWPGRDFLDTLAKIAGTGYPYETFLVDFPPFLHTKIATPKLLSSRRENRRYVIPQELDTFYSTVVEPWVYGNVKVTACSRKRRKTNVNEHSKRTVQQRGENESPDIELPRRSNPREPEAGTTSINSALGLQEFGLVSPTTGSRPRHTTGSSTPPEEAELDINDENALLDDYSTKMERTLAQRDTEQEELLFGQQPFQAGVKHAESARRHVRNIAPWQEEGEEAQKEHIKATLAMNARLDTQDWRAHVMADEIVDHRDRLDAHEKIIRRIPGVEARADELEIAVAKMDIRRNYYVDED